jgi:hypothetical protein
MSRRITTIAAAALAAAAVAAPTASAVPDFPVSAGASPVPERTTGTAALSSSQPAVPVPERTTEPDVAPVPVAGPTVVVEADDGPAFDWGSAAIGAGVALAIILLGVAAASVTSRHGRLRPSH